MPKVMQAWRQQLLAYHPTWKTLLWQEDGLVLRAGDELLFPSAEQKVLLGWACHLSQRSNIWRYILMYHFGGLYLDTDIEPRKPFDDLVSGRRAFVAKRESPHDVFESAFFGGEPGHPWLEHLMRDMKTKNPHVSLSLGASYLTSITKQHPDVEILSEQAVQFKIPTEGWSQARLMAKTPNVHTDDSLVSRETYAIHHWSSLWFKDGFKDLRTINQ